MSRHLVPLTVIVALSSSLALAGIPELEVDRPQVPPAAPAVVVADRASPASDRPAKLEGAPSDARRLPFPDAARARLRDLDAWFSTYPTERTHAALDRPLYRPGDTVSFKAWDLATKGLAPVDAHLTVQLVDPRGTVQQSTAVQVQRGGAAGAFPLPADAPGGSWKVQIVEPDGTTVERPFVVASFETPRVKKTLDFARDGYGPGELVEASITLERSTGEPLANAPATARVRADGQALDPIAVRTDAKGRAVVTFSVPTELSRPDVMLTVLVDDGGVTESITRPVPVVLDRVQLAFFPEGGDLVSGLPARVYFEATDASGEPADVTGTLVDDRGREVATLGSWIDGRGHVSFRPVAGRTYRARIDRPGSAPDAEFALPEAKSQGCVLHHHDDLDGAQRAVRVSVSCTAPRDVVVLASQQEQVIDKAAIHVDGERPTTVYLQSAWGDLAGAQGVARVTVLGEDLSPLAERLVFRNRGRQLGVAVRADKESYAPGEEVVLTVRTTDPEGRTVPAELSLSVVDDTLLSFADDTEHDLLSGVLLQADLPDPIEDVADLFDPEHEDGGLGLDLVLGTRGWRRFDWTPVIGMADRAVAVQRALEQQEQLRALGYVERYDFEGDWGGVALAEDVPMELEPPPRPSAMAEGRASAARGATKKDVAMPSAAAPVRQFAAPISGSEAKEKTGAVRDDSGPRTDFRDTVLWQPVVRTGADGVTKVRFPLSDAVTGFRVTAEGVGDHWLGRGETLLATRLPFHLDARLPVALSAGDVVLVPVTFENQQAGPVMVDLDVQVGDLLRTGELPGDVTVGAGQRRTVHVPLTAGYGNAPVDVSLAATAGTARDAVVRRIPIVPRGFPQHEGASGVVEGRTADVFTIPDALEGSITGRVTIFPTPVSELLEGAAAMVRQPGGCFEQTSSTNYPNVLVLDFLDRTGAAGRLADDRERILEAGYTILTGYQVDSGGFETWGPGPGKEALSAFGVLQFTDMSKVFEVDPRVIEKDVAFLYRQRNGKGGYENSGSSAHGYGTAPPEVLDAYITYALVETGHRDLDVEIDAQVDLAERTNDPYRLALATLTLLSARPEAGRAAAGRLAKLQIADGSFPGSETSITRSENGNLTVEATALASMALLRAGDRAAADRAVRWVHEQQLSPGIWGASQANALALKAIAAAATAAGRMDGPGHVEVTIDGELVQEASFEEGRHEPLELDLGPWLSEGRHTVSIALDGGELPYAIDLGWSTDLPVSAEQRRVDLETSLARSTVAMGETVRLTATLSNRSGAVVPDPIARIGLPAGLQPQTWQLEQLKDRGVVAFFETRPREVTLYWDGLGADEVHEVVLDLVADVPGTFEGPASSAYPYYDDEARAWAAGLDVKIAP